MPRTTLDAGFQPSSLTSSAAVMCLLVLTILCFSLIGCKKKRTAITQPVSQSARKTIQIDDALLYFEGDDWVFAFPTENGESYIIGRNVAFVEVQDACIVVNIDQKEPQKQSNPSKGTHVLLNVPKSGTKRIRVVTQSGVSDCNINPGENTGPVDVLRAVLLAG